MLNSTIFNILSSSSSSSSKQIQPSTPNEKEASDLLIKGEEKLKSNIFEKILNKRKEKLEESIELFEKAGFIFINLLKWKEAGEAFEKCASIEFELLSIQEAAEFYIKSGQCFYYIDKEKLYDQVNKAVNCYLSYSQYDQAGSLLYELAEYYRKTEKYDRASFLYKQSSDVLLKEYFSSKGLAYFSLLKFADMQILMNNHKSIVNYDIVNQLLDIYSTISCFYMKNRIIKTKAKEVYRKLIVLSLLSNENKEESIEKACFLMESFKKDDETFIFNDENCFDGVLINKLLDGFRKDNLEFVTITVNEYLINSTKEESINNKFKFGFVYDNDFGVMVKIIVENFIVKFYK